jgi:hypothetical protein
MGILPPSLRLATTVCMTPERLRAYVLIFTRDLLPPLVGAYLTIRWWGTIEVWQLPLLAGLFGVPLVAPRSATDVDAVSETDEASP